MTDTARPDDEMMALREAIDTLTARLDRLEAEATQPFSLGSAKACLTGAWDALRGSATEPADTPPASGHRGLLLPLLMVCAVLLGLILAVEPTEEIFDGFRH